MATLLESLTKALESPAVDDAPAPSLGLLDRLDIALKPSPPPRKSGLEQLGARISQVGDFFKDDQSVLGQIDKFVGESIGQAGKSALQVATGAISGAEVIGLAGHQRLLAGIQKVMELHGLGDLTGPVLELNKSLAELGEARPIGTFLRENVVEKLPETPEGPAKILGQAIGGVAPSFALGAAGGAPLVIGVFGAAMFNDAFEEAEAAGVSDGRKWANALAVGSLSLTEAIPVGNLLAKLDKGTGGVVKKSVARFGSKGLTRVLNKVTSTKAGRAAIAALETAPEEAFQEAILQKIPENIITRLTGVDPDRAITEGVKESALLGALGGAIGGAGVSLTRAGRPQPLPTQERELPDGRPPKQPQAEEIERGEARQQEAAKEAIKTPSPTEATPNDVGIANPATDNDVPTTISTTDVTQPVADRQLPVTTSSAEPGRAVTSPEGTVIFSPTQEAMDADRASLIGPESEVPSTFKRGIEESAAESRKQGLVSQAVAIASEVNLSPTSKPRILDDIETAALSERGAQLKLEIKRVAQDLSAEGLSDPQIKELGASQDRVRSDFDQIISAIRTSGSSVARSLRSLQLAVLDDFSFASIIGRAKANKGTKLSGSEESFFTKRINDLESVVNKLRDKLKTAEQKNRNAGSESQLKRKRPKRNKAQVRTDMNTRAANIARLIKEGCI